MSGPQRADRRRWFERETLALLPDLYGAALRLTRNEVDAEDLVAEAIARAWMNLGSLRDDSAFRGWVFRTLTNTFLSRRRKRSTRGPHKPLVDESGEENFSLFERLHAPFLLWSGNPERGFLDRLLREDLERAVDSLPEEFRVVVVLADIQGFSYREVAETLEIPIGTVRSRLSRGRSRLQRALWAHAVDAGLRSPRSDSEGEAELMEDR